MFADVEYLLWQPRRRALDYAISSPTTSGAAVGSVESLNWQAASGFRLGGGAALPNNGWGFSAYYTYLHTTDNRFLTKPDGGTLYATLTHPGFVDAVDTAAGATNLNYNVLDVEVGRPFVDNDTFRLRLFGGGRFAWIDQGLNVYYNGQTATASQVSSPVNFNGAGVRVGGEGQWLIGGGVGLYGRAAGSLLAGDFRTRLTETNGAGALVITDVTDRYRKVVPVAELGVGLGWQFRNVRARVGYEITNWFGMVDSPDFVHDFTNKFSRRVSDLSLDGLVARLTVAY